MNSRYSSREITNTLYNLHPILTSDFAVIRIRNFVKSILLRLLFHCKKFVSENRCSYSSLDSTDLLEHHKTDCVAGGIILVKPFFC